MKLYTFSEVDTRLRKEVGIETESEVTPYLMMALANSAIDELELIINDLHMDYFLTSETLAVTEGVDAYSLPSEIYSNRIRFIQFNDGSTKYQVEKINIQDMVNVTSGEYHKYRIINKPTGIKIKFFPTIAATSADSFEIWFIRNAKRITDVSDVIDIGEGIEFILSHMRLALLRFYPNPAMLSYETGNIERQRASIVSMMTTMAEDGSDSKMQIDTAFYQEHE